MDVRAIGERLEQLVPQRVRDSAWLRPRYPLVGLELREDAVLAVRLEHRRTSFRLAGHGRASLDPGVFSAGLLNPAIGDPERLARAAVEALQKAGAGGAQRVSLALPDTMIRVFVVDLDDLPGAPSQAAEMIRWRVKKSLPFKPEEARLSWQVLGRAEDGRMQVLVAVAPEEGIKALEALLGAAGLRVGLVDLASFDLYNALRLESPAPPAGDFALVNATPAYFSILILRGDRLILYRSKAYHVQGGFSGEESLRVVSRELRSTLSYYDEHLLGEGLQRLFLRACGVPSAELLEVARAACGAEARLAHAGKMVAELKNLPEETVQDLLPAVGLALRRVS